MLQDASFAEAIVTNFKDDQETRTSTLHFDTATKQLPGKAKLRSARIRRVRRLAKTSYGEKGTIAIAGNNCANLRFEHKVVRETKAMAQTDVLISKFY